MQNRTESPNCYPVKNCFTEFAGLGEADLVNRLGMDCFVKVGTRSDGRELTDSRRLFNQAVGSVPAQLKSFSAPG